MRVQTYINRIIRIKYIFVISVILLFAAVLIYHFFYGHFFPSNARTVKEGVDKQWYEYVDVIYYINLENREDRKTEFLEEMRRLNVPDEKIVRINAVYKPGQGDLGCSLSHIIAIEQFMNSGLTNCIVFEDDFTFTQDLRTINSEFQEVFDKQVNYSVIMLSASEIETANTEYTHLKKVNNAQTTSGYMLTKHFAPVLLQNYKEGVKLLEDSYKIGKSIELQHPFCIDQYWKRLQPQSNWYMFLPKLGVQRESHSDIQGGVVNYGV